LEAGANPKDPISNDWGMSAFACAVLNNQTQIAELMFPKVERQGFAWTGGLGKLDIIKTFFAPRYSEDYKANSKLWTAEEADQNFNLNKDKSILVAAFLLACINGKTVLLNSCYKKALILIFMFRDQTLPALEERVFTGRHIMVILIQ